jgi:hypothetical protein
MCYLAGDPQSFIDVLSLIEIDHKVFLRRLSYMSMRSGTDQKMFYNQSRRNTNVPIKHLERGWIEEKYATGRLDKVIWPKTDYNAHEYIDCHLPRPLSASSGICKELFNKLKID